MPEKGVNTREKRRGGNPKGEKESRQRDSYYYGGSVLCYYVAISF